MSPKLNISKHARIRCQQRGLAEKDIWLIYYFGQARVRPGGALEFKIMGTERQMLVLAVKKLIKNIERM